MFSPMSVCPQGGMCGGGTCVAGVHVWWWGACVVVEGMCGGGACMVGSVCLEGHVWYFIACMVGGMCGRGHVGGGSVCMAGGHVWTGQMATTVGGMHPTGMHSCLKIILRV